MTLSLALDWTDAAAMLVGAAALLAAGITSALGVRWPGRYRAADIALIGAAVFVMPVTQAIGTQAADPLIRAVRFIPLALLALAVIAAWRRPANPRRGPHPTEERH